MKILHLDSSVLGPGSMSRKLSAQIVDQLRTANPTTEVVCRDLAAHRMSDANGISPCRVGARTFTGNILRFHQEGAS